MPEDKIILAYSGGLDTSVAIRWLQERYQAQIVTLTIDLGMVDLEEIRQRAIQIGALNALTVDGKEAFYSDFISPALRAGAIYEDQYPLATALGRPLIARYLVEAARREGAYAIAHGCTGKGNDQVRLDVSVGALAPELKIIAPIREWGMSREEEVEYAHQHDIPVPGGRSPYSVDENLWGRSIETGDLEDPWREPPEAAYSWTRPVDSAPSEPTYLEIGLERGLSTSLDGEEMSGVDSVRHLNHLAGEHGVGRIDHIENRLVGIKSREVYEAPAAGGAPRRPQSAGGHGLEQRADTAEVSHSPGVRRRRLQRAMVHSAPRRHGRLRSKHTKACEWHRQSKTAQRQLYCRGPEVSPCTLQPRVGHLRPRRYLRSPLFRRFHIHLWPSGAHTGTTPG